MYEGLPNFVYEHASSLGLQSSLQVKDDFVSSFLKKTLPANRLDKGEDVELQHKFQMLDNAKWKKEPSRKAEPAKKRKLKLTAKEKRKLKLFEIEKEGQKYEDYLPLNELWQSYMKKILGLDRRAEINEKEAGQRVIQAELHGCNLLVYKSRCPSYVGIAGIVLKETKNLFTLITKENKVKSIPKENSVFMLRLDNHVFTIHGNNFKVTAAKRAGHKFKLKGKVVI